MSIEHYINIQLYSINRQLSIHLRYIYVFVIGYSSTCKHFYIIYAYNGSSSSVQHLSILHLRNLYSLRRTTTFTCANSSRRTPYAVPSFIPSMSYPGSGLLPHVIIASNTITTQLSEVHHSYNPGYINTAIPGCKFVLFYKFTVF